MENHLVHRLHVAQAPAIPTHAFSWDHMRPAAALLCHLRPLPPRTTEPPPVLKGVPRSLLRKAPKHQSTGDALRIRPKTGCSQVQSQVEYKFRSKLW